MTQPVRSEDTLLALAGHLSWVVGLPILVPLVIFLLRGDLGGSVERELELVLHRRVRGGRGRAARGRAAGAPGGRAGLPGGRHRRAP